MMRKYRGIVRPGQSAVSSLMQEPGNLEKFDYLKNSVAKPHVIGSLFPGSLNVSLTYALPIVPDLVLDDQTVGRNNEKHYLQRCWLNEYPCYRFRPYQRQTGCGGHGDHVIELLTDVKLRDKFNLSDLNEVDVEFNTPDLPGGLLDEIEVLRNTLAEANAQIKKLESALMEHGLPVTK